MTKLAEHELTHAHREELDKMGHRVVFRRQPRPAVIGWLRTERYGEGPVIRWRDPDERPLTDTGDAADKHYVLDGFGTLRGPLGSKLVAEIYEGRRLEEALAKLRGLEPVS